MSLVLKNRIEESANAVSFRIYDTSTGWGTDGDPDTGDILTAILAITSQLNGVIYYDMLLSTRWTEYLSSDGLEVPIANVYPTLEGFPDDYYSFRLMINETGNAIIVAGAIVEGEVEFDYTNNQGFMAYIREAARKLPLPLNYDNFDYEDNREVMYTYIIMDSAEADANQGNVDRFEDKMEYVSEQLNTRGIAYDN